MQIATTLLNYGAETNILTKQGVTPLHLASQEGHTDMVTLLLEKGSNIHVATKVTLNQRHTTVGEWYPVRDKAWCGNDVTLSRILSFIFLQTYL